MTTKTSNDTIIEILPANVTIREEREEQTINLLTPKKKIKEKKKEKKIKEKCSICFDFISTSKNMSKTPCGHVFCLTCLHEHLKINHTCPNCRKPILSKKPEKPLVKIKKKAGLRIITQELKGYDMTYMLDHMEAFPDNAKHKLKCLFQEFGYEIMKQFQAYQINGNEENILDYTVSDESEEDSEEEEEEEIDIVIDHHPNRHRLRFVNESSEDEDSDDEDSEEEAVFEG
tara:strand:- start:6767 stop:7456 length:690 start_codon:yes stop_codon:yes gene_type:complete